jgi:hypothetical protein
LEQHWQETPQDVLEEKSPPFRREPPSPTDSEDCRKILFLNADFIRFLKPDDEDSPFPLPGTSKLHAPCQLQYNTAVEPTAIGACSSAPTFFTLHHFLLFDRLFRLDMDMYDIGDVSIETAFYDM